MWKIFLTFILALAGLSCASPGVRQNVRDNDALEEIKNNQNGISLEGSERRQEIGRDAVQILQGDGAIILVFGLATIAMILAVIVFYFRHKAKTESLAAEIMAKEIAAANNSKELGNKVLRAAENSPVEGKVYSLINRHRKKV